jgi:RecA-family ATPase
LLVGKQGLGKSTFAAQLCAAIQQGKCFLGRQTIKKRILFIQADSPTAEWREMLRRIAPKSQGYTMVDVPAKCLGNPAYLDSLYTIAQKVQPGFIVFDSLYNLTNQTINTESVLIAINQMKAIAGNVPWLLIHHPPHNESRAAGHHSVAANCSNEWHLTKNKLSIAKGRLVKDKEILLSRDEHGLWVLKEADVWADDFMSTKLI